MHQRLALWTALALSSCSVDEPAAPVAGAQSSEPKFAIAYQQVEGSTSGVMVFFDEPLQLVLSEFRDEREAIQKGSSESYAVCSADGVHCVMERGKPPILSDVPAGLMLEGQFRYSATPVRKWAFDCRAVQAIADRQTTGAVICPMIGVVEITYSGPTGTVDRYELKSYRGLFAGLSPDEFGSSIPSAAASQAP